MLVFILGTLAVLLQTVLSNDGHTGVRLELKPEAGRRDVPVGDSVFTECRIRTNGNDESLFTDFNWIGPDGQTITDDSATSEGLLSSAYVDRSKANEINLYMKVAEEQAGQYTCQVTYAGNEKLSASFNLTTFIDIHVVNAPTVQHPIINREGQIQCEINGNPPPKITWTKNGVAYVPPASRCSITQTGIHCNPIAQEDDGKYVCRARVVATGQFKQVDIQVEVHIPPDIPELDTRKDVIEGEEAVLHCTAHGKPLPAYNWKDKNNADLSATEGFAVNKDKGDLTIVRVTKEMEGLFTCVATNAAGFSTQTTTVKVVRKPKFEKFLNETVNVKQTAVLHCTSYGDPAPNMYFIKDGTHNLISEGTNLADNRYTVTKHESVDNEKGVMVTLTLTIIEVRRSDDGLYICSAENSGGKVDLTGHLQVQFPPQFIHTSIDKVVTWIGKTAKLTCIAESIPNATITWKYEQRPISIHTPNLVFSGEGPNSTLQVTPADRGAFGNYYCIATNALGPTTHMITLQEATKPDPVLQVKFDKVTATTITFHIVGPSNTGGLPIENYVVEYVPDGHQWINAFQRIWSADTPYELDNLEPEKHYRFRFATKNAVGQSDWTAEESKWTLKRSAPGEPVIFELQSVPYPDKYEVHWRSPADNGEPIDQYIITYYPVINTSSSFISNGDSVELTQNTQSLVAMLDRLTPNTLYKIEVRAHNAYGNSQPGTIVIRTAQGQASSHGPSMQTSAGLGEEVVLGIVVAAVVLIVIVIDVCCFVRNRCGLTMCICSHLCAVKDEYPVDKNRSLEEGHEIDKAKLAGLHESDGFNSPPTSNGDTHLNQHFNHRPFPSEETPMIQGRRIM